MRGYNPSKIGTSKIGTSKIGTSKSTEAPCFSRPGGGAPQAPVTSPSPPRSLELPNGQDAGGHEQTPPLPRLNTNLAAGTRSASLGTPPAALDGTSETRPVPCPKCGQGWVRRRHETPLGSRALPL